MFDFKRFLTRNVTTVIFVAVLCVLTETTAAADDACPPSPPSQDEAIALASEWFNLASRLVEEKAYRKGSDAYLCSYSLIPHSASLLNAALAAQMATDIPQACDLYAKYLTVTEDAEKKQKVEDAMNKLSCATLSPTEDGLSVGALTDSSKDKSAPADEKTPPPRQTERTEPLPKPARQPASAEEDREETLTSTPEERHDLALRVPGGILLSTGGAGIAVATVFQILAARATADGKETSDPDAFKSYQRDVNRFQAAAILSYVSGGLLCVVGGILLHHARSDTKGQAFRKQHRFHLTGLKITHRF